MRILLALVMSFSALANFSGKWSAKGYYESDRREGECKEVFMQFKQTESSFEIIEGGYICGDIQASYPPSFFKIVENELYYKNEKVGNITNKAITISYLEGVYSLDLKKDNGEIVFTESWKEGEDFLTIYSKLEPFKD